MNFNLMLGFAVFVICATTCNVSGAKKDPTLTERVSQLSDLALRKPVLSLNSEKYRQYIKGAPRDYSFVVMFTALAPSRQCGICKDAADEFKILGNSWRYSPSFGNQLFFGQLDFDEGSDVFQSLKLNSAPVFIHFPAKGRPKKLDTLDIQRTGFTAEGIASWVEDRTEIKIRVFRPPNYTGAVAMVTLLGGVAALLYLRRNSLGFLKNTTLWGLLSLSFVFLMTSGQMWNHIRGPPFMQHTRQGAVAYIHGSSQGQFVVETYIVALLYACVTLGMIVMTESANVKYGSRRNVMAIVGLALVVVFYSVILSVFRTKTQGYPYSFLFK